MIEVHCPHCKDNSVHIHSKSGLISCSHCGNAINQFQSQVALTNLILPEVELQAFNGLLYPIQQGVQ